MKDADDSVDLRLETLWADTSPGGRVFDGAAGAPEPVRRCRAWLIERYFRVPVPSPQ